MLERQVHTRSFPRMVVERNTDLFLPNYPQPTLHVYKYSGYKFITVILLSRQHIPSTATRSNNTRLLREKRIGIIEMGRKIFFFLKKTPLHKSSFTNRSEY